MNGLIYVIRNSLDIRDENSWRLKVFLPKNAMLDVSQVPQYTEVVYGIAFNIKTFKVLAQYLKGWPGDHVLDF